MKRSSHFEACEYFLSVLDKLLGFTDPYNGETPIETSELVIVHDPDYYDNLER